MAGPKFDLEWEFGARLTGLSRHCNGFLVTSSSAARELEIGAFRLYSTVHRARSALAKIRGRIEYISRCLSLARKIRRSGNRIDVVVSYDPLMTGLIGWIVTWFTGAKLICEVNGDYTAPINFMHVKSRLIRSIKRCAAGMLARFVLRRAAGIRVLYDGQLERLAYATRHGQRVARIPDFVNIGAFRNLGEVPVVLLVGFPFFVKGVDIAIAAFKRVSIRHPDWKLKLMGYYPDAEQLQLAIAGCEAIFHHPPVLHRHMNEHIGNCGIVFQPSRTEAMGRVLVEAMAAGKARVASRIGGIPTVVEHGHDGLLVESEDVAGFADALDAVMSSPELRSKLGAAARERAGREFAPEQYSQRMSAFFQDVLSPIGPDAGL